MVEEAMSFEQNYRLKSVHCYDMMEHPSYSHTLTSTERKVRKYKG